MKAGAQEGTVRELLAKVINTGRKWDARIVRVSWGLESLARVLVEVSILCALREVDCQ